MASQFQNRLLGTVILVTIGVIVLPDVFDGQKQHHQEESFAVPIAPKTGSSTTDLSIEMPLTAGSSSTNASSAQVGASDGSNDASSNASALAQQETNSASNSNASQSASDQIASAQSSTTSASTEPSSSTASSTTSATTNSFQGNGWIIQLMSLKNKENALKVVEDLKNRGYLASVQETNSDWVRVLVGPDVSKEKLEKQIAELEEITSSKGQVRAYNPTN